MSNFQPLEVVGRGSETQLQVAENLNRFHSWTRVNPLAVSMSKLTETASPNSFTMAGSGSTAYVMVMTLVELCSMHTECMASKLY